MIGSILLPVSLPRVFSSLTWTAGEIRAVLSFFGVATGQDDGVR
jgi:hypothetical protein